MGGAGPHQRLSQVRCEEMAFQVRVENLVELFFRDIESLRTANSRVAEEHVQPTKRRLDEGEQRLQAAQRGDIDLKRCSNAAGCGYRLRSAICSLAIDVGYND